MAFKPPACAPDLETETLYLYAVAAGLIAISAVSCSISDCNRRISSSGPSAKIAKVFGSDGRCSRLNVARALLINSNCSTVWSRMASLLIIIAIAAGPSADAEHCAPG